MGRYTVRFTREIVETDEYFETIEADSKEAAEAIAEDRASDMDMDCPDEARPSGEVEIGGWEVGRIREGDATAEEIERVTPDQAADCRRLLADALGAMNGARASIGVPSVREAVREAIGKIEGALAATERSAEAEAAAPAAA